MSNTFIYEQGWLVEKPEIPAPSSEDTDWYFNEYREHINSLRRFKYDYPDPGKEMELGKDFETAHDWETMTDIAILIERTYSEQDLLDVWDAAWKRSEDFVLTPISSSRFPSKKEFFKQKFGIEIK